MKFKDLGLDRTLTTLSNGMEVLESLDITLSKVQLNPAGLVKNPQPITLLILDINMPGLNGFTVARQVKRKFKRCNSNLKYLAEKGKYQF